MLTKIFLSITLLVLLITLVTGCGRRSGGIGGNGGNNGNSGGIEVQIMISPTAVIMDPDDVKQFTATVTGTSNPEVIWSVTGDGTITNGLYNPGTTGTYQVTATSVADPMKKATATVEVKTLRFVAVGNSMKRYRTEDGINWDKLTGPDDHLYGIAYINNTFVAVGGNKLCCTYSKDRGESWSDVEFESELEPEKTYNLYGIAYGNGRFVAVGDNGRRIVFDGENWINDQEKEGESGLSGVAYGKGHFVTIGHSRHSISTDGGNTRTDIINGPYLGLNGIAYESELPLE